MNDELMNIIKNEELLIMEGYDDCIIGIGSRANSGDKFVVYNTEKIISKLVNEQGFLYDEAVEFYEFNQACAWHGCKTPAFVEIFE